MCQNEVHNITFSDIMTGFMVTGSEEMINF